VHASTEASSTDLNKAAQPAEGNSATPGTSQLQPSQLRQRVLDTLEEAKAQDIKEIDVTGQSPLTDCLVIASGSSTRHVKAMAEKLVEMAKRHGVQPLGIEGEREAQWILVDLNDVIVHLMLPQARAFYNLEKLWEATQGSRAGTRSA
jgi:ribosome-associated protein